MTKIRIYGTIGRDVTPASMAKELDAASGPVTVHLNSFGGDAYAGITIANQLAAHNGKVTAIVEGLAASAASIILTGADEVLMYPASEIMVHEASIDAGGNSAALAALSTQLNQLSENMATAYADHAGGTPADWRQAMKLETWFTAADAVKSGLASRIIPGKTANKPAAAAAATKTRPAAALLEKEDPMTTQTEEQPTAQDNGVTLDADQTREVETLLGIDNIDAAALVEAVKKLVNVDQAETVVTEGELNDARAEAQAHFLVDTWIKEGRFTAGLRDQVVRLATIDPQLAMDSYGSRPKDSIPMRELGYANTPSDEVEGSGKRWVR